MKTKKNSLSLAVIALLQAFGLIVFCSFVGTVLFFGSQWFRGVSQFIAPLVLLILLSTSALICGLITLSYPVILFFNKKQPGKAVKLVIYTVLYLVLFIGLFIVGNLVINN